MLNKEQIDKLRTRLYQAIETKDPYKVLIQTDAAIALFRLYGWPNDWATWTAARDEAETELWMPTHAETNCDNRGVCPTHGRVKTFSSAPIYAGDPRREGYWCNACGRACQPAHAEHSYELFDNFSKD